MSAPLINEVAEQRLIFARKIYAMLDADAAEYSETVYLSVLDGSWDEYAYLEESGALEGVHLEGYEVDNLIRMARDHAKRAL